MMFARTQLKVTGIAAALWLGFVSTISYAQTGYNQSSALQDDTVSPDQQEIFDGIKKILSHNNLGDFAYISEVLDMKYTIESEISNNMYFFTFHFYKENNSFYAHLTLKFPRNGTVVNQKIFDNNDLVELYITVPKDRCVSTSLFEGWTPKHSYQVMGSHAALPVLAYGTKQTDANYQTSLMADTDQSLKCINRVILTEQTNEQRLEQK